MPNDFKRPDCVEFHERFGRNHRPNEYGDEYERAVEETLSATATQKEEALGGNPPTLDLSDPAQLEAFYGNFAFFDHYRKSILAQCHELERAKAEKEGTKVTEAKLENLARLNPIYLDFLNTHFQGRHQREQNVRDSLYSGTR